MSKILIHKYYKELEELKHFSGSSNEMSIRNAFLNLIDDYCKLKNKRLVTEIEVVGKDNKRVRPDGTIKDSLTGEHGYIESKDEFDDIDEEINKKFQKGYPDSNILFEDSNTIVLFQAGKEVMRASMKDEVELERIIHSFINYEKPEIQKFRESIDKFKENLHKVIKELREMIEEQSKAKINPLFVQARSEFWDICKNSINPNISLNDINEMLIQHILTEEIFISIFSDAQFHKENNIARQLYKVEDTFFIGKTKRQTLDKIKDYYEMVKARAVVIVDHHEKQDFLKAVYESFYTIYNPKAADRLGIVYTPTEIVKFMISSTEFLLHTYFSKFLSDEEIEILDPCTGTGTFITELIDYLPKTHLEYKYKNEIHCNEVAILPYYIANLNIEYTYKQKMKSYEEFKNICFVDTIDNVGFQNSTKGQQNLLSISFIAENADRIKKQNQKKISIIIGNPPYNANQMNENDNNKNRDYFEIDRRIKESYITNSSAQKTKLYDMYTRFFRWASDRLYKNGIISFVSNNTFLDSKSYDGFRKVMLKEFNYIYIINLKGNARTSGEQRRKEGGNIFQDKIRVGIAVYFMIRVSGKKGCDIFYTEVDDYLNYEDKRDYLSFNKLSDLKFKHILPDQENHWINIPIKNDWNRLIPLFIKQESQSKQSIFHIYSNGVATNRDSWVYDIDEIHLRNKVKFFANIYNDSVKEENKEWNLKIKWSRDLKNKLNRKLKIETYKIDYSKANYRPFYKVYLAIDPILVDVIGTNKKLYVKQNKVICTNVNRRYITNLAVDTICDLHFIGDTQCLPLYTYDSGGNRQDNITDWALEQFHKKYENKKDSKSEKPIAKEDIFHYVYAVLHNPTYRKKYELNLKRDFPRIPFYKDFWKWADWGKELIELHIGYETVEPYSLVVTVDQASRLKQKDDDLDQDGRVTTDTVNRASSSQMETIYLKADKENGKILIDSTTTIVGIPPEAWKYQLGNRSALEWILDQYKESKPTDKTIAENFDTYRFADYKEQVIDLIKRVCTVSIETIRIQKEMEELS